VDKAQAGPAARRAAGRVTRERTGDAGEPLNLPSPCVVVLAGPGAAGKSTWAAAHFPAECVVSSDRLRGVVGAGTDDVSASADAFALLEQIVRARLSRPSRAEC